MIDEDEEAADAFADAGDPQMVGREPRQRGAP